MRFVASSISPGLSQGYALAVLNLRQWQKKLTIAGNNVACYILWEDDTMSEEEQQRLQQAVAKMRAITISREYGSGGGEVAARLAKRLGWRLVDHEVVVRVAR